MSLFIFFFPLVCTVVTGRHGEKTTTPSLVPPLPTATSVIYDKDPLDDHDDDEVFEDDLDDVAEDPLDELSSSQDHRHRELWSDWFAELFGFRERGNYVHKNVQLVRNPRGSHLELVIKTSGKRFQVGTFEMPTLKDLRHSTSKDAEGLRASKNRIRIRNIVADVRDLHRDPSNEGAVFQVANQTNFLEMTSPHGVPEDGITGYINDHTQGPACAMECAPGTLYRNYFVNVLANKTAGVMDGITINEVTGRLGQTRDRQLDALGGLAQALGGFNGREYWRVRNGYAIPISSSALLELTDRLKSMSQSELEILAGSIAVGVQKDTQVSTVKDRLQTVSQVYCSALPIGYVSGIPQSAWEPLATLVLDSIYESTMLVAEQTARHKGGGKVFLTLVGGGVFRNNEKWIVNAIEKAVIKLANRRSNYMPLDIYIVHYNSVPSAFDDLVRRLNLLS